MGPLNGPVLARSTSTWIHCLSCVASANRLMSLCGMSSQVAGAELLPDQFEQILGSLMVVVTGLVLLMVW